jgi:hypothetical protein
MPGFHTVGGWEGFTLGVSLTWGDVPPHQLEFLGIFSSGFENLITLLKCNFKAFRSRIKHFNGLETHLGGYFHF